jgi:hypothetical protein
VRIRQHFRCKEAVLLKQLGFPHLFYRHSHCRPVLPVWVRDTARENDE